MKPIIPMKSDETGDPKGTDPAMAISILKRALKKNKDKDVATMIEAAINELTEND